MKIRVYLRTMMVGGTPDSRSYKADRIKVEADDYVLYGTDNSVVARFPRQNVWWIEMEDSDTQ